MTIQTLNSTIVALSDYRNFQNINFSHQLLQITTTIKYFVTMERGFKELMQRASSLFSSKKPLKYVTVEFGFALTTAMNLG